VTDAAGRGRYRAAVWLLALSTAGFVAATVAYGAAPAAAAPDDALQRFFFAVVPLVLVAVGGVVAARRPRHVIGWLLLGSGWLFAVSALASGYAQHAGADGAPAAGLARWVALAGDMAFFPAFVLVGIVLPLVFPDGRLPSRRWRVVGWGIAIAAVAEALSIPLRALPAAAGQAGQLLYLVASALFPPLILAVAVAVVLRFRRATGIARLQFKWVALPTVLFFAFLVVNESGLVTGRAGQVALAVLFVVGFGGLPVGVGVAVLRYRLYAIDRIISRTLAYGLLTVVVVGLYAAGVVGLGAAVRTATGRASSDVVVALSTLTVAAVFQPARRHIQAGVERRFNRSRYDAQRTVEAFARQLRDAVDVGALTGDLHDVVAATVQPARSSLWLRAAGDDDRVSATPRRPPRSAR
jgi:hypothetical protein